MDKYLYTFRYHAEDTELYKLELKYVFGKENFLERTFTSDELIPMESTCFGEVILEILAFSEELEGLKEQLQKLPIYHDAKLDSLSLGFLPKCSFNDAMKILPYLKFYANMKNPSSIFLLTRNNDGWYFGKQVSKSQKLWNYHRKKKHTMSSAIPQVQARTLVESLYHSGHRSLIDFCCGSGTFLLDAVSFGMKCTGIDLNETMTEMTSKNLSDYNYTAAIEVANAASYSKKADCGVVDFPYGFHCTRDENEEKEIISNVLKNVKTGVFIFGSRCDELFGNYEIIEYLAIPAVNVTRHIYFCRNKNGI